VTETGIFYSKFIRQWRRVAAAAIAMETVTAMWSGGMSGGNGQQEWEQ